MNFIDKNINLYAQNNSSKPPKLLVDLALETQQSHRIPEMMSSPIQGRFLKMLVQLTRAQTILEIGTFTGYSSLSMAEALGVDGKIISCDLDKTTAAIAQKYFDKSPHGHKIEIKLGNAIDTISELDIIFDMVFIDADKVSYNTYFEAVLPRVKTNGLIVFDNTLWSGTVLNPNDESSHALAELNEKLANDERIDTVLLPVRDGLTLVYKK